MHQQMSTDEGKTKSREMRKGLDINAETWLRDDRKIEGQVTADRQGKSNRCFCSEMRERQRRIQGAHSK